MLHPIPYLSFNGNCAEAMRFYERALGGTLYAGDCPPQMKYTGMHGVGLTLNFETVAQAATAFNSLAEGGQEKE
jgi:PhnB protein